MKDDSLSVKQWSWNVLYIFWLASPASSSRRLAAPFFAMSGVSYQNNADFCHKFSHQRLSYTKIACSPVVEVTQRRERVSIFI